MKCFCCSNKNFLDCCKPFLDGVTFPSTAEELMRSRYSAFCTSNLDYLNQTALNQSMQSEDTEAQSFHWIKLTIINKQLGEKKDTTGTVEFKADFTFDNGFHTLYEISQFKKISNRWYYTGGVIK